MSDQSYSASITIEASAIMAYESINRIADWWTNNLEGSSNKAGDYFTVRFGETYVTCRVEEMKPLERIVWLVTDCHKHWLKNKTEWIGTHIFWFISQNGESTAIHFTHQGLKPDLECFKDCERGWDFYFKDSYKSLLATGKGKPDTPKGNR